MTVKCRWCAPSRKIFQLPTSTGKIHTLCCNVCQGTQRAPIEGDKEVLALVRQIREKNGTWRDIAELVKREFGGDWLEDQSSGEHLCYLAGIDRHEEFWNFVRERQVRKGEVGV